MLLHSLSIIAQPPADTTRTLDSVTVKAFEQHKNVMYSAVAVTVLPYQDFSPKTSLVNGLNTVSGVRMEERSPGSYRISIRGSSLRSPFGVRNIKVYWNNLPITDPGGNTYFNQFAWNNFAQTEIFKGPAASLYGAGMGGLILLDSWNDRWKPGISAEYINGSYGLNNIFVSGRFGKNDNKHVVSYAHNETDGYRVQTAMRRDNFSWASKISKDRYDISTGILFTDLYYQTPGALTTAEFNTDPKAARPAGGGFPSAVNAKAAIYQKNVLAGVSGVFRLAPGFRNTTTFYGAFAQIKNAAIRNYERRNEPSFGGRTVFDYKRSLNNVRLGFVAGTEWQQGYFNTLVSKNRNGNPDTVQTNDDISNTAMTVFAQATADIQDNWFLMGSVSVNKTKIAITRLSKYPVVTQSRTYRNEIAPMFSVKRIIRLGKSTLAISGSVARGFSPPTTAEVLPSTGVISTELEAEQGWNYESSVVLFLLKNKLKLELTGFYLPMKDALVQRRDISGADFFVNAGEVNQKGLEFHVDYKQRLNSSIIKSIAGRTDITYNHFRYGSFVKGSSDFTGKTVPSVPSSVYTFLIDAEFAAGLYLNASYYAASAIFLDDANTFKDDPYHLLGMQAGIKRHFKQIQLNIFAGADNLLNETYSLGNDINAAAGRFYNAAPKRNYYAGVSFQWIKKAVR